MNALAFFLAGSAATAVAILFVVLLASMVSARADEPILPAVTVTTQPSHVRILEGRGLNYRPAVSVDPADIPPPMGGIANRVPARW